MNCKKCSAEVADGAKYCSVCGAGKKEFKAICPYCCEEMSNGRAIIQGTIGGFLLYGFSRQHLFFQDEDGDREIIIKSGDSKEAYLCLNCEGLFVPS